MRVEAATAFWYAPQRRYVRKGEVFGSADEIVTETPPAWWRTEDEQATARPGERRNTKRRKADG